MTFDAIEVGDELPPLAITLTPEQVAGYAAAANMPGRRFYDDEAARAEGLSGQIVPGNMSLALFSRLLTAWTDDAVVCRLSATFRGLLHPGQPLLVTAVVTEKHSRAEGDFVACDLMLENEDGERRVTGTATLCFPRS